jgi:Helix-turn-helix domain
MSTTTGWRELTVRQAARRARRAEETIRRWIWSGRLPARKRGHTYVVLERDLDAASRVSRASAGADRRTADRRSRHEPSLAEWVAEVEDWRARSDFTGRGSAAELVLEDRRERSERWFAGRDERAGR